MIRATLLTLLACTALTPLVHAQTTQPQPTPQELAGRDQSCEQLVQRLQQQGESAAAAGAPVSLAQAREYQRNNDSQACRLAMQRVQAAEAPQGQQPEESRVVVEQPPPQVGTEQAQSPPASSDQASPVTQQTQSDPRPAVPGPQQSAQPKAAPPPQTAEPTPSTGAANAAQQVPVQQLKTLAVWSAQNQRLGDVLRVVTGPGNRQFVIIGHGGFLGLGERQVALPLDNMQYTGERLIVSGVTEPQLTTMPEVRGASEYRDMPDAQSVTLPSR